MINSCAVYIFANVNNAYYVLIGKRGGTAPSGANLYNVPVGMCEHNETPEETAIREVFEETGINISNQKLINVNDETYNGNKIGRNYLVILKMLPQIGTGDGENEKFEWVNINDINNYRFAFNMNKNIEYIYKHYFMKENIDELTVIKKGTSAKRRAFEKSRTALRQKEKEDRIKNININNAPDRNRNIENHNGKAAMCVLNEEKLRLIIRSVLMEHWSDYSDCDYAGETLSSFGENQGNENNETFGKMCVVTVNSEKSVGGVMTLSQYNKYCKDKGFKFKTTNNLIGGYFVDENGDCYKFIPKN